MIENLRNWPPEAARMGIMRKEFPHIINTSAPMPKETLSAIKILTDAFEEGRPIVPFLGAGVSVGTGFPTMTAITAYLAKVRFYIQHVARDRFDKTSDAEHIRKYGWPDIHLLNADVWHYLADSETEEERLGRIVEECRPVASDSSPQELETLVKERWENRIHRVRLAIQLQLLVVFGAKDSNAAKSLWRGVVSGETVLRGDWYDLMMSLTEGDFDPSRTANRILQAVVNSLSDNPIHPRGLNHGRARWRQRTVLATHSSSMAAQWTQRPCLLR